MTTLEEVKKDLSKYKNDELYEVSGEVKSDVPLVSLFYTMIRDGIVSPSKLEELIRELESVKVLNKNNTTKFCNGYIAQYCIHLVERINKLEQK